MLRTPVRFVRGTAIALLLGVAPIYSSVSAQTTTGIEAKAADLDPGDYVWSPAAAPDGPIDVVISLPQQLAYVYRGGNLIGVSTVSTGSPGNETPVGRFNILQKRVEHYSNLYDNAPMPYMQRLTWDGIALHAGALPGYPASHGCIRLPKAFAQKLYKVTELGARVVIVDEAPASAEDAFALAQPHGGEDPVELASNGS